MSRPRALLLIAALVTAAHATPPERCDAQATPVPSVTAYGTPVPPATPNSGNKETSLQRIQRYVASINKEASTPEGEEAVVARLSQQLHASPDSLTAHHATWGLGYGEIAMVYGFARDSKKPNMTPEAVVDMRRSGMDWENIGKALGVKVDNVASRMGQHVVPKPKPTQQPKKDKK